MPFKLSEPAVMFENRMTVACDIRNIRDSLDVELDEAKTFVVLVAVNKQMSLNTLASIACDQGQYVSSYVYDPLNKCYRVSCASYLRIGHVPVSYRLKVFRNVGAWNTYIPLPEPVLLRHMSQEQRDLVQQFKGTYGDADYTYEYIQVVE